LPARLKKLIHFSAKMLGLDRAPCPLVRDKRSQGVRKRLAMSVGVLDGLFENGLVSVFTAPEVRK
jgi:hypothetical protein